LSSSSILNRLATGIGIAPEGMPYALGAFLIAIILHWIAPAWLASFFLLVAVAVGAFFRDPHRASFSPATAFLSAADGKVTDVREGPLPGDPEGERFRRVSVFMSPLNVHVNRAPAPGVVEDTVHSPGKFLAAFRDDANEHNERNLVTFTAADGRRFAIMQIAGYLARRIVCHIRPHDSVVRGERIGLIMFGSRVDHYIPLGYRVTVQAGDRVRAGVSVIGDL
jgi:phosphatidylserine decarboxylase